MKILALRFSALGDIAMTVPVVVSFCQQNSQVQVVMLTSKLGAKIYNGLGNLPHNLTVRGIDVKKDYKGIGGLNRLYHELKAEQFDAVADLHDVLRTQWVRLRFKLAGTQVVSIDKGRSEKKAVIKHKTNQTLKLQTKRYAEVFEHLGFKLEVNFEGKALSAENHPFDAKGLAIGVAPSAQHKGKVYPRTLLQQAIANVIKQRPEIQVFLFGGPDEQAELDTWAATDPTHIVNTAGREMLADDLALMQQLKLVVSMDSANMHLASLVGTRVISIWGATHPKTGFMGYKQQESDAVQLDMPCRPCSVFGNKPCQFGDWRCLSNIDPETITRKIVEAL